MKLYKTGNACTHTFITTVFTMDPEFPLNMFAPKFWMLKAATLSCPSTGWVHNDRMANSVAVFTGRFMLDSWSLAGSLSFVEGEFCFSRLALHDSILIVYELYTTIHKNKHFHLAIHYVSNRLYDFYEWVYHIRNRVLVTAFNSSGIRLCKILLLCNIHQLLRTLSHGYVMIVCYSCIIEWQIFGRGWGS